MIQLQGLEGVSRKKVNALHAVTANACITAIRHGLAATTAKDNGSITAWKDDAGKYRVARHRYCATQESKTLDSLRAVSSWWKTALEAIV